MPIDITLQVKLALEESALEDALEEFDEITASDLAALALEATESKSKACTIQ